MLVILVTVYYRNKHLYLRSVFINQLCQHMQFLLCEDILEYLEDIGLDVNFWDSSNEFKYVKKFLI